jgi:hypothetical protein
MAPPGRYFLAVDSTGPTESAGGAAYLWYLLHGDSTSTAPRSAGCGPWRVQAERAYPAFYPTLPAARRPTGRRGGHPVTELP